MCTRLSSVACLALLAVGCGPFNPPYVRAPRPEGVEHAHTTTRDGHVFYWVKDRWYVRSGEQWFAYPPKPKPLNQYMWR